MLEDGRYTLISKIAVAVAKRTNLGYANGVLRVTLLALDIVKAIMD
jgi:hypothetical protein